MKNRAYNVIWVDDEVDTFMLSRPKRMVLDDHNINIIHTAKTGEQFADLIKDRNILTNTDAIITDANFDKYTNIVTNEREISGFVMVMKKIDTIAKEYNIPFFLFTGRAHLLEDKFHDGLFEYFETNNRIFDKNQFGELCEKIVETVDEINSPAFRIRTKYGTALEKAAMVEGNEAYLMKKLIEYENGELENPEDIPNALRRLIDRIMNDGKIKGIYPPQCDSINDFRRFLLNQDNNTEWKNDFTCPPALGTSVDYMIRLTQDGSHESEDLEYRLQEFISLTRDEQILMSLIHIALRLCEWHHDVATQYAGRLQTYKERNFLVKEVQSFNGRLYCDKHEVKRAASDGDKIRFSSKHHKTKSYNINRYGDVIEISTILLPDDYEIIKDNQHQNKTYKSNKPKPHTPPKGGGAGR